MAVTLSVAERSYPTSEVRSSGQECEADSAGTAERSCPSPRSGAAAERSYPMSEARGGDSEEPPCTGGQEWQPGGTTQHHRPGVAARRCNPRSGGCTGARGPRGAIPH